MPQRVTSTIKYAEKFAEDKNTPIVMQGLIQYLYENYQDYDDTVKQLSQDIENQVKRIVATFPQQQSSALMVQGLTNLVSYTLKIMIAQYVRQQLCWPLILLLMKNCASKQQRLLLMHTLIKVI
jgi:hypothetical protein